MQMSQMYQSTNKKLRASQLRRDGSALRRAGFDDSAEQNFEMAEILDPTPREENTSGEVDKRFVVRRSRAHMGAANSSAPQGAQRGPQTRNAPHGNATTSNRGVDARSRSNRVRTEVPRLSAA